MTNAPAQAPAPAVAPTARTQPTRLPLPRARSVSHLRTQSTSAVARTGASATLLRKPSIPLRGGGAAAVANTGTGTATTTVARQSGAQSRVKQDDPFRAPPVTASSPAPAPAPPAQQKAKVKPLPARSMLDLRAKPAATTTATAAAPLGTKKTVPAMPTGQIPLRSRPAAAGTGGLTAKASASQIIRKPCVSRLPATGPGRGMNDTTRKPSVTRLPSASTAVVAPASPAPPAPAPAHAAAIGTIPTFAPPPAQRLIRRMVSRGFRMDTMVPDDSPLGKTTHTPSPTKRPHSYRPLGSSTTTAAINETPLLPRLQGMVPIDEMPMIADASLSFSQVQADLLESPSKPGHALERAATTLVDNAELESARGKEREAEKEKEQLQAALRASEAAFERIKQERDEAKKAEQLLEAAVRDQRWEMVITAIQDEMERNREYRDVLARYKQIITLLQRSTGGHGVVETTTASATAA